MHPGRFFPAKACYKVVFKSVKIPEAIVFHSDPYLMIPYLMIFRLPASQPAVRPGFARCMAPDFHTTKVITSDLQKCCSN